MLKIWTSEMILRKRVMVTNVMLLCFFIGALSGLCAAGAAFRRKYNPSRLTEAYSELVSTIVSLPGWEAKLHGDNLAELRYNDNECSFFLGLRRDERMISVFSEAQYTEQVNTLMDSLHPSGLPADIEMANPRRVHILT